MVVCGSEFNSFSTKLGFSLIIVMILLDFFTVGLSKSVFHFFIVNTIFQSKSKTLIQISLQYISINSTLSSIFSQPWLIAVQAIEL